MLRRSNHVEILLKRLDVTLLYAECVNKGFIGSSVLFEILKVGFEWGVEVSRCQFKLVVRVPKHGRPLCFSQFSVPNMLLGES